MRVGVNPEGLSELLRSIVLEILRQQRDIIVCPIGGTGWERVMAAIEAHDLEVVVLSESAAAGLRTSIDPFRVHPLLKLLELSGNGRSAALRSRQGTLELEDISPEELVRALWTEVGQAGDGEAP